MKILTKKKQEEIFDLLVASGVAVAGNSKVPAHTYNKVNRANSNIAKLMGGDRFSCRYHSVVGKVLEYELAKMGGKRA